MSSRNRLSIAVRWSVALLVAPFAAVGGLGAQSSLKTIDAVSTVEMALPSAGVRGLLFRGDSILLLVSENQGLSAPDSSFAASIVRYWPDTGKTEILETERDAFESGLTANDEFLWAGGSQIGAAAGIYQLDPRGGEVLQVFPAPGYHPGGMSWDGSHLWQVDADARKLYRIDAEEGRVSRKVATPGFYPTGLAHDGFHFWCADAATGRLYRLRGTNGRPDGVVSKEAYLRPGEFVSLAWDGSALWCVGAADSVASRLELLR